MLSQTTVKEVRQKIAIAILQKTSQIKGSKAIAMLKAPKTVDNVIVIATPAIPSINNLSTFAVMFLGDIISSWDFKRESNF